MTRILRNLPIKRKLIVLTVVISGVALLIACAAFAIYEQSSFRRQMARDFGIIADMFDDNVASGLAFDDPGSIALTLGTLRAHPRIMAACVYDADGVVVAEYRRPELAANFEFPEPARTGQTFTVDRLDTFKEISLAGEVIGVVYVGTDLQELKERAWRYSAVVALLLVACSLVALVLASRLQKVISEPILELARTAAVVATERNYALRARKRSLDETGRLIDAFNHMLEQIQTRDAALQDARDKLERRVEERTKELVSSVSLLNATLESTTDGILAVDLHGRVMSHNSKFVAMWQFPPEMLARKNRSEIVRFAATKMKDPERFLERMRILAAEPESESFDVIELKDGRTLERYAHPQRIDGRTTGVVMCFRDITARKRAEEEATRAQARFKSIFDIVPIGLTFMEHDDLESRVVNPAHAEITGVPVEHSHQLELYRERTHPEDRPKQDLLYRRLMTGEIDHYELEKRYVHLDGTVRWATLIARLHQDPITGEQQEINTVVDITARKHAEAKLAHERDLLRVLLDSSPDSIYFKDRESRFVRVSKSNTLKMLGREAGLRLGRIDPAMQDAPLQPEDADLLLGLTEIEVYGEDIGRRAYEATQSILRTGEAILGAIEKIPMRDGHVRWNLTDQMPWRDEAGNIIGTFGVSKDITALKEAEEQLAEVHKQLIESSRQAGMAEVATGVLHNVGNVLNSVNVSTTLLADQVRQSKITHVAKLRDLLRSQPDLAAFFTSDPRARQLPGFLDMLCDHLAKEQAALLAEVEQLRKNVEHIKDIVAMQQNYAKVSGVLETIGITELIEDAVRMNSGALARHDVRLVRDYQATPMVTVEKHKVLQILVNLMRNAKYACDDSGRRDKEIIVRVTADDRVVQVALIDNGVGIAPENLTRIFGHGFTTRKDGHGFGLHSGALAARELGGSLYARSDGPGKGATFILEIPLKREAAT